MRVPTPASPPLAVLVYVALISVVVYDDVVLCKWLYGNVKRKWAEAGSGRPASAASEAEMKSKSQ